MLVPLYFPTRQDLQSILLLLLQKSTLNISPVEGDCGSLREKTPGCFVWKGDRESRAQVLSWPSVGLCPLSRLTCLVQCRAFFYAIIQIVFNHKPSELWDWGFRAYKWPLALPVEPQHINISASWCSVSSFAASQTILNVVP